MRPNCCAPARFTAWFTLPPLLRWRPSPTAVTGFSLLLAIAGWCFVIGICLFSLSLFALALTQYSWFAAVTPFGGTALLVGWAALGLGAARR